MRNENFDKTYSRRTFLLGVGKTFLLAGITARLVQLQFFNRDHYRRLSDKNRTVISPIIPLRGNILDIKKRILAINDNVYACLLNPELVEDPYYTLDQLQKILMFDKQHYKKILRGLQRKKEFTILVQDNLSWQTMALLQSQEFLLPGLFIDKSQVRKYVKPEIYCHVLGYVAAASPDDLKKFSLPKVPGIKVGKAGIEFNFEKSLFGSFGERKVEVNALRKHVRVLSEDKAVSGDDLQLNISAALQEKTSSLLSEHRSAAAVVLDVNTGAVKSLVSHPGYDTNDFVYGISHQKWNDLLNHPDHPLTNKIISGQYAPGSTFKMVVALAALEAGVVKQNMNMYCPGHYDLGSHRFHCWTWKNGGHGNVDIVAALSRSCDVFFYKVAMELGSKKICETAEKLGLGLQTGIALPHETKGLIPNESYFKSHPTFLKHKGNAINISIGQGIILTTPLQLAFMTSTLVNGGKILTPLLSTSETIGSKSPTIDPKHLEVIKAGMDGCVNQPGGTAYFRRHEGKDWAFGGKSGSTQVSRITMQQRRDGSYKDLPYHLCDHALFVGYAPIIKPKHAVCVLVEHGKSGGRVAAPLAREILYEAHKLGI